MESEGGPVNTPPASLTSPRPSAMELTPATVPPFAGDPYPDLHRLSYQFLQNIKVRFGEDSASSIAIHNVLGDFAAGSVSKRETFLTIWDRLRDHEDLRHELDALLRHDHARWSPQDFRPLQNTTILHVPDFLQPQHEPSLPVPRFSNGAASSSALQCASDPVMDPALLHSPFEPTQPAIGNESLNLMPERSTNHHGHDGGPIALSPHSYAPVPPSPATESQFHVSPFTQHTPLAMSWQQVHSYPSYVDYTGVAAHEGHTSQLDMTPHLQHSQYHAEGWSSSPHATPDVQSTFRQEHVGGYHTSPQAVSHDSTLQSTPSNRSYYFDNHVPVQETVPAPPHGNPLLDPDLRFAHPFSIHNQSHQHGPGEPGRVGESGEQLPERRNFGRQQPQKDKHQQGLPAKDGLAVIDTPRNSSPATPLEQPSTTKPNPTSLRTKGHFVHSLCGKAFTTRSGVKKHHWGARLYDKNTTSGCWAKNGKPDVDWDDHPSCKDPPQDDKDGDIDSEQQASPTPVAQMVVPARHATTTTQVPTSRESSARARQCTAISPSTPHTAVRPGNPFSSPGPLSTTADDHNLQTLITAVNVASSIESPAPQTRNDSVVTHLDAQVKSWEHQAQAQHQNAFLVPDDQARTQSIELQHNGSGCGGGYGSGYLADTRPSASASASASVPPNQSQNQNFDLDPATFVHEYAGSDKAMANSMLTGNAPARGTPAIFAENHSHGGTALDLNRSQNRSFVLPSQNQINVQKRGRAPTTLDGSGSGAGLAARPAAGPQVDGFALNPDAPRKRQRSGHGNGDGNGNGSADAFGKGRQRDAKGESV